MKRKVYICALGNGEQRKRKIMLKTLVSKLTVLGSSLDVLDSPFYIRTPIISVLDGSREPRFILAINFGHRNLARRLRPSYPFAVERLSDHPLALEQGRRATCYVTFLSCLVIFGSADSADILWDHLNTLRSFAQPTTIYCVEG
jgi:hypothetical protein